MLRLTQSSNLLTLSVEVFCPNYTNLQIVRWARKPRFLPTAKSKLFRVPQRPKIPHEDVEELKRLHNIYRTEIKSLKNYFFEKYAVENLQKFDIEQHKKKVEEDFVRCNEINDAWNRDIKVGREARVIKEHEENIKLAQQRVQDSLHKKAEQLKEAEKVIRREKEASVNFITPEKLDDAIEHAINNPVDYNFSIDLDGNVTRGRDDEENIKVEVKQ